MEDEKLLELANTALSILKGRNQVKIKKEYFLEKGCRDYVVDSWIPTICKYVTDLSQLDIILEETQNLEIGFLEKDKVIKSILNIS
ncbi:MAG: hypothetical protein ACRCU6_07095 [Fusobacteriaceae bacterium]